MCVNVDSNHKGIPDDIKDEAEKWFFGYNIEYKDLQRPCRGIVTELPSSKKQNKEKVLDLSRKIGKTCGSLKNGLTSLQLLPPIRLKT